MPGPEAEELRRRIAELEAERDLLDVRARPAEELMAELQHRVRNMLAVIRAVVKRTSATAGGRDAEDVMAHLSGRIDVLARTQSLLTRTGEQAVDLAEIVRDEFVAQGGLEDRQFLAEGPSVKLHGMAAETLGLALHELATNAVKFGAWSGRTGRVEVRWQETRADAAKAEPSLLALEWTESGAEYDGAAPDRTGFGLDLIEHGLPYALGARTSMEFRAGGIRCLMTMELAPHREGQAGRGPAPAVGEPRP